MLRVLSFILLLFIILACTDEEIVLGVVPELHPGDDINLPPSDFELNIKEITDTRAFLNWGPVYDIDGDTLHSLIYLGESMIAHQKNSFLFTFNNLKPNTEYSGKIVVTDSINNPIEVDFVFTTKKHFSRFDNLYTNYEGNLPTGFSMIKTNDGGYAVAGNINFDWNGGGLFVAKIDSLGYEQWHTSIEGHYGSPFDGTIIQTNDNRFAIVDQSTITKLNSNGDLLWQRYSPSWDQYYNSIIETPDFGYLVVGLKGGLLTRGTITKFNKQGGQEWENLFDGNALITMTSCSQIIKVSGDKYLIAGTHQKPNYQFELSVAKIDSQGNIFWTKAYDNPMETFYMGVEIKRYSGTEFIIGSSSLGGSGERKARVVKIDEDGILLWDNLFSFSGYETTWKDITVTDTGEIIFVGSYSNFGHYETAFITKLNGDGTLVWRKDYAPSIADFVWFFQSVQQSEDGGLIFMGYKSWIWSGVDNSTGLAKDKGLWILKTDENGE